MIDLHSHLLPAVDDGARDLDEARHALARMANQGVRQIALTPHVDASLTRSPAGLAEQLAKFDAARAALDRAAPPDGPRLHHGAEIRLDIPNPDLSDARLRLAGNRTVLVEFAHMSPPPTAVQVLYELRLGGHMPLLAHPERYSPVWSDPMRAREWVRSAVLQSNAGSFLGWYGERARASAFALLREGLVGVISSDYHARGEPALREARVRVEAIVGPGTGALLFEENPARVLAGEDPLPVPGRPSARGRRWWGLFKGRTDR